MAYEEPERMRDIIAEGCFNKKFEDLSDEEKLRVHELAKKIWSKLRLREAI